MEPRSVRNVAARPRHQSKTRTESPAISQRYLNVGVKQPQGGVCHDFTSEVAGKERHMRNRKVQRELRRMIGKEEKLDPVNYFGIKDPTPRQAVNNMIHQEAIARAKERARQVA